MTITIVSCSLELEQQLFDSLSRDGIESAGRLVEQEHAWVVRERACDAQTLLLSTG